MAPRSKFTAEQVEMMQEYREKYLECQAVGDYTPFWAPFFEDYHARWPEREHLFPDVPLDVDLTPEQKVINASMVDTRKKQLTHRFRNAYGNYTVKRKLKAQTTSAVEKMLTSQSSLKGTRTLQPAEAYSKLYYKTRIKPVVDAEMKVLKQEAGLSPMTSDEEDDETSTVGGDMKQALPKKTRLSLVKKHTRALFANETPEIKAEVADFVKQWSETRENRRKTSSEDDDISSSRNIEKLPNVLADIFSGLAKQTGWAFSVLMGGPSPGMGGKIQVESFHVGQTAMGNTFNLAYSDFNERIMKPYAEFAKHAFPDAAGKGTPSPGPSLSKPACKSFEDTTLTTLTPIDFITTNDTSLPPPRPFDATSLPLPRPFDNQPYDVFSTLETSGPAPLFENNGPILPMPEGYTPPTANSPSLDLFDSALFHSGLILPLSQGYTPPTANPSSTLGLSDLLDAPLYPNWPGLPSNKPVIPTSSVSLHPSVTQAGTLASETPAPLPASVAPASHIPTSSISLHLSVTPAGTLASETPAPLPTSVAPASHIPTSSVSLHPSVTPAGTLASETPAPLSASVAPASHIPTSSVSLHLSVTPAGTLASETPAPLTTSVAPAEHVASETPALPIVEPVDATSTPSELPAVEQPLLLSHPRPVLPSVQPPQNLTQPSEEHAASKGAVEGPQVNRQQHESLVLGRSKRERKESTRNEVANSIGSGNIGKENSTSKKRPKSLTHGAPAKKQRV